MIDTHAHIKTPLSAEGRHPPLKKGETLEDLGINGLDWVVLAASSVEDSKSNLELAKINNKLLASVGIHPQEKGEVIELEKLMNIKVIAVGECGLDFSGEFDKDYQEKLFRGQIELAIKYNKPLIVHSRKAMEETLAILKNYQNLRGVIHCYSGGIKRIKNVPESFYFGIDGNLTYEDGLMEVVRNIPKDRLLLETDSPYLTPIPLRGEINYPQNVKYIYEKVAEIWGTSFEETEKIIDENVRKLFL